MENLRGTPFSIGLYYEREGEKDVYTITTVDLSGIYQSRTADSFAGSALPVMHKAFRFPLSYAGLVTRLFPEEPSVPV